MTLDCNIHSETEGPAGWSFVVDWQDEHGTQATSQLKLAFADYNHWCASGSCAPEAVARAVIEFMANQGETLPGSFDCSLVRRKFRNADEAIRLLVR